MCRRHEPGTGRDPKRSLVFGFICSHSPACAFLLLIMLMHVYHTAVFCNYAAKTPVGGRSALLSFSAKQWRLDLSGSCWR